MIFDAYNNIKFLHLYKICLSLLIQSLGKINKEYLENINSSDLYFIDNTYSISLKDESETNYNYSSTWK